MEHHGVRIDGDAIAEFCRHDHIRMFAFFGSSLTDGSGPGSGIDALVQYERGAVVGPFDMARMETELSEVLGREVDLRTPGDLSRYFRDRAVDSAEVLYAA
jgi:uncharacterized protein